MQLCVVCVKVHMPLAFHPEFSAEFDRKVNVSKKTKFPQSLCKQTARLR